MSLAPEIRSDGATATVRRADGRTADLDADGSSVGEPVPVGIPEAPSSVVPASGSVQAELGGCEQLVVTWPEDRRGKAAKVEVDELLWVNFQAGSPLIDARFKCRSAEGPVRHLRIWRIAVCNFCPPTAGRQSSRRSMPRCKTR